MYFVSVTNSDYFNRMKITALLFLLIGSLVGRSQENESFYAFDANWKPTKIQTAHFSCIPNRSMTVVGNGTITTIWVPWLRPNGIATKKAVN